MVQHFATTLQPSGQQPSTSKDIAQFLLSSVKLKLRPTDEVLDAASAHMVALIQRPLIWADETRSIAVVLRSFYHLRYSPTIQQASYLLKQFVSLCDKCRPQQLELGDIENVNAAAAGLGLTELGYVVQGIGLQALHAEGVRSQQLCTVCRSMAMLNVLDLDMLETVLSKLHAQGSNGVSRRSVSQLYKALYSLQPFPRDSKTMHTAWGGAHQQVEALGNQWCVLQKQSSIEALDQVLAKLHLRHRTSVQMFPYTADAVLQQKLPGGGSILVAVVHETDVFVNSPGRYVFRVLPPS